MLAFGIILILVALGGGGYLGFLASRQTTTDVTIGTAATGLQLSMLPVTLFAAGAASVLLLWVGFKLTGMGFRRKRAARRELRDLRAGGGTPSPPSGHERTADPGS